MVKSEQEIEHIQKACDIVCDGINYIKSVIQIGMTEKEVADLLAKRMFANGATGLSFPTIVSFGKNSANIHSTPTDKKLEKNEMILIDAGCVYEDYCSDITRCW
jgi:Xaa-Pro aminopeptidase